MSTPRRSPPKPKAGDTPRIDENKSDAEYLTDSIARTKGEIGQAAGGGEGYVGFDQLPTQVHTRSMKAGFAFNIMCVGETGLGKTTFLNTLFLRKLLPPRPKKDFAAPPQTLKVEPKSIEMKENGVTLDLTLLDTPGFGGKINNEASWEPLISYIDAQNEQYLEEENKPNRQMPIKDTRVHCCLYFVDPSGPAHGLKMLDVELMKRIHKKVNIIPVVAKADTMTRDDLTEFKKTVREEIKFHEIHVYEFPEEEVDVMWPFAIVGSTTHVKIDGAEVLGREYPWGVCEVENESHSDFVFLRQKLVREFMIDLIETTSFSIYEEFRKDQLHSEGFEGVLPAPNAGDVKEDPAVANLRKKQADFERERKTAEEKWKKWEQQLKDREEKLRKMVEGHKKKLEEDKKKKG